MVLDHGQLFPVFLRGNDLVVILLADRLRKALCPADLVVALFRAESHGKGLIHVGNGCHIAGIHAAGQERANFYIGDLMRLYAVVECIGNAVDPGIQVGFLVCLEMHIPVALHLELAVLIGEIVRRRQLIHALEKGLVTGRILEGQIVFQCGGVQHLFEVRMAQKALDFRAEQECLSHLCIVHGLDAKEISCAEEFFLTLIPDHEGEHSTQLLEQFCAVLLVAVDQHLRVGLGGKVIACLHQTGADLLVVIDLAVEQQRQIAVLAVKRLCAGIRNIDDAQAAVSQCNILVNISTLSVRATVLDLIQHLAQDHV